MSAVTIYHNPRCSKSRQTLALLEEQGITPEVVLYLEAPPSPDALAGLIAKLGITPWALLRRGEAEFKALGLNQDMSDAALIDAMVSHPKLIERPIVVVGNQAALGRPPEQVLDILP